MRGMQGDMNNPRSAVLTGQGVQGVAASSQRPPRPMERCLHLIFGRTLPIEHSTNAGTWDPLILPRLVVGGLPCRSALSTAPPASRARCLRTGLRRCDPNGATCPPDGESRDRPSMFI